MQSNSSGDASLVINNSANIFDDSGVEHVPRDNLEDISRLSFSDMMLKGMPVCHIHRNLYNNKSFWWHKYNGSKIRFVLN